MSQSQILSSENELLLRSIVTATSNNSHVFTSKEQQAALVGYIEVNAGSTDKQGNQATRANAAGVNYSSTSTSTSTVPTDFEIEDGISISPIKRGAIKGASKYPFDDLKVGQSFHIPSTSEKPNPEKTMASVVTNKNKSFSKPDPSGATKVINVVTKRGKEAKTVPVLVYERRFACRKVDATDAKGSGARIWRTI